MRRALLLPFALVACSDAGSGAVSFSAWGEEFIEQGIPASAFADGWSVKYDQFVVELRAITVADGDEIGGLAPGPFVLDLVRPGPHPMVTFSDLAAKNWRTVRFQLGSMHVRGVATHGVTRKTFDWTFDRPTLFDECQGDVDGRLLLGALVTDGGTDRVQITLHGDHLFYDDLQAGTAQLRFSAIAEADANGDGVVTRAELEAVRLAAIPAEQGPYGTGSAAHVDTLGAFVAALARTVAHFRGEGECFAKDVR